MCGEQTVGQIWASGLAARQINCWMLGVGGGGLVWVEVCVR